LPRLCRLRWILRSRGLPWTPRIAGNLRQRRIWQLAPGLRRLRRLVRISRIGRQLHWLARLLNWLTWLLN